MNKALCLLLTYDYLFVGMCHWRDHHSWCTFLPGILHNWSRGSQWVDRSYSVNSCRRAAPSCGHIWHNHTLESRWKLTTQADSQVALGLTNVYCISCLHLAKFFFGKLYCFITVCYVTHLLEANLERAHPAWSLPPFKKKSTCPTGMDIPKSSQRLFIKFCYDNENNSSDILIRTNLVEASRWPESINVVH